MNGIEQIEKTVDRIVRWFLLGIIVAMLSFAIGEIKKLRREVEVIRTEVRSR